MKAAVDFSTVGVMITILSFDQINSFHWFVDPFLNFPCPTNKCFSIFDYKCACDDTARFQDLTRWDG